MKLRHHLPHYDYMLLLTCMGNTTISRSVRFTFMMGLEAMMAIRYVSG